MSTTVFPGATGKGVRVRGRGPWRHQFNYRIVHADLVSKDTAPAFHFETATFMEIDGGLTI